jgi:hypothetical protein
MDGGYGENMRDADYTNRMKNAQNSVDNEQYRVNTVNNALDTISSNVQAATTLDAKMAAMYDGATSTLPEWATGERAEQAAKIKAYSQQYAVHTAQRVDSTISKDYIDAIKNDNTRDALNATLNPPLFDANDYTVTMNGVARRYNNGMNDGQSWYLSRNVGVYTATYDARATSILQNASSSEKEKAQATIYMQNRIKDIYNQDLALQQVISKAHQQTKDDLLLISGRDATGQVLPLPTDQEIANAQDQEKADAQARIDANQLFIRKASDKINSNNKTLQDYSAKGFSGDLGTYATQVSTYSTSLTTSVNSYYKAEDTTVIPKTPVFHSKEATKLNARNYLHVYPSDINQYTKSLNSINVIVLSTDPLTNSKLSADANLSTAMNNYIAYSGTAYAAPGDSTNPYCNAVQSAKAEQLYYKTMIDSRMQASAVDISGDSVSTKKYYEVNGKYYLKAITIDGKNPALVECALNANGMPLSKITYTSTELTQIKPQAVTSNADGTVTLGGVILKKPTPEITTSVGSMYVSPDGKYYSLQAKVDQTTGVSTYTVQEQQLTAKVEMQPKTDGQVLIPVTFSTTSPVTATYSMPFTKSSSTAKRANGGAIDIYTDNTGNKYAFNANTKKMDQVTINTDGYAIAVTPSVAYSVSSDAKGNYSATAVTSQPSIAVYVVGNASSNTASTQFYTKQQAFDSSTPPQTMLGLDGKPLYYFADIKGSFYIQDGNKMVQMESQNGKPLFHELDVPRDFVPSVIVPSVQKDFMDDTKMTSTNPDRTFTSKTSNGYWSDEEGNYYRMTATTVNGAETYSMVQVQVVKDKSGKVIDIPMDKKYSADTEDSTSGGASGGNADNKTIYERVDANIANTKDQRDVMLKEYATNPSKENCDKVTADLQMLQEQKVEISKRLEDNLGVLSDPNSSQSEKKDAQTEIVGLQNSLKGIQVEETKIQTATTEAQATTPLTPEQSATLGDIQTDVTATIAVDEQLNDVVITPLLDFSHVAIGNGNAAIEQFDVLLGMQTSLDQSQVKTVDLGIKIENANTIGSTTVAQANTPAKAQGVA